MNLLRLIKKIPIDLGQGNLRKTTKGKLIALNLIPSGEHKTALDVGCREGTQSKWLESKGYQVISIDIKKNYNKCVIADVNLKLPFADESFSLIWCSEVIEHLKNPEFTVSEFRRILTKGGEMILTTPNSYFWIQTILTIFGLTPQKLQRRDHTFFFAEKNIKKLFPNAELYGFFPYFLLKLKIKKLVGLLSPTFIIHEKKL